MAQITEYAVAERADYHWDIDLSYWIDPIYVDEMPDGTEVCVWLTDGWLTEDHHDAPARQWYEVTVDGEREALYDDEDEAIREAKAIIKNYTAPGDLPQAGDWL